MKLEEYDQIVSELEKQSKAIRDSKRPAYTLGKKDVLTNFKEVASRLGITPMQVWGCYFLKHIDSITSYVRDTNIPQAEPLVSRFCDARNYLDLGYALMIETKVVTDDGKKMACATCFSTLLPDGRCPNHGWETHGIATENYDNYEAIKNMKVDPVQWMDKLSEIILERENSDKPIYLTQEEFERRMKDYEDSIEKERRIRKVKRYQAHF